MLCSRCRSRGRCGRFRRLDGFLRPQVRLCLFGGLGLGFPALNLCRLLIRLGLAILGHCSLFVLPRFESLSLCACHFTLGVLQRLLHCY